MAASQTNATPEPDTRQFRRRARLLTVVGVVIAFALGAAFMSIGHHPQPRNLPIAVVGNEQIADAVEAKAPDQLSVTALTDLDAAKREIAERDVYGAVVPSASGGIDTVLIASSASNQVANFLRQSVGQPTPEGTPTVVDVAPWPEDDSAGLSINLLLTVIILGGTGSKGTRARGSCRSPTWPGTRSCSASP
jgi:hypothetical protein